MSLKRFTPNEIAKLKNKEVFVFGSNIQGEHVGGAAKFALDNFGAENGCGFGLQGRSYAIPTCRRVWSKSNLSKMDRDLEGMYRKTIPFDNVNQIKPFVDAFINDAKAVGTEFVFYVTKIGCGIAGFKLNEIAELFRPCIEMDNVILPKEFVEHLLYSTVIYNLNERGLVGGKDYDDDCAMAFVMDNIEGRKSLDDILDEFENLPNN